MCGICGIFAPGRADGAEALAPLAAMNERLAHRGPDDAGLWTDTQTGLGLGHRRLSILDLSPLGRQPMASASGRFVLCFNGEVYNHLRLRAELEPLGHRFRGGSDTETMLAAIEQWGLGERQDGALARFNGMFAFALWDAAEQRLTLVRDRLGVKPLYVGTLRGGGIVFGSELKALRAHPDFDPALDRDALGLFFRHNYIPAPHCVYANACKLLPGEALSFGPGARGLEDGVSSRYWDADAVWRAGFAEPFPGSEDEALDGLERLLSDAVSLRMLADVPLGAFLSGGIDSSLVTALMQRHSALPVRSFSIGFREAAFNEAPHARAVAAHLGCQHTELTATAQDLLDIAPHAPRIWDEPFADSSQIPTLLLCRLTRGHVTVALSGDGGDELFSGYERYPWALRAHGLLSALPGPVRPLLAALGRALPRRAWALAGPLGPKLRWRLDALGVDGFEPLYRHFVSLLKRPEELVPGARDLDYPGRQPAPLGASPAARRAWMSLADILGYLPDDILTKVDRASMSVALEARNPLLDYRVVEYAARLPMAMKVAGPVSMKMAGPGGKAPLRRLLHRHVPPGLVDRPKMGFGVPLAAWLRGELAPWARDLLSPALMRRQGVLDADFAQTLWRDFENGEDSRCHALWSVLMFQAWLAANA
jgi:asparagine synthase (glutamine-hydrolysing)